MNSGTRDAAGQRRKPPDARAGCPESRLGLPLSDSPPSGLQAKKCSSSLGRVFFKISVLWSPAGPLLCLASALCSEAGSPWAHVCGRPFRAGSRVVCVWPRHSGGPSGRRRGHSDGVTGRALARDWGRLGGSWRARGAGCADAGAPGRAHRAGRAELGSRCLQHHGQVARLGLTASWTASPRGVMPISPGPSSSSVSTRQVPDPPLPRRLCLTSSGSQVAPGTCCPGAKKMLQAPRKTAAPALQNNPPPSPATRTRHCSCLLCPTGVSRSQTAPFSSQPTRGAGSLGSVQRIPSRSQRPTIRLPARGGRRGEWGEGGGGRLGRCLLL